jgi:hypothetical protein
MMYVTHTHTEREREGKGRYVQAGHRINMVPIPNTARTIPEIWEENV